jgi:tRNA threonylcarbamoyladenosine biosynthesis protein TsaB
MLESSARILAIETSSRWGSAAVGSLAGPVATGELPEPMSHARDFAALVQNLLERVHWPAASLTHVFVSVGPGSFTGLRIGVTLARTLAWPLSVRIVAVPTLDALARNALQADPVPERVAVLLDAKRSQVYAGAYETGPESLSRIAGPSLERPAEFLASLPRPLAVMGEGVGHHQSAIDSSGVTVLDPRLSRPEARNVFALGLQLAHTGHSTSSGDLLPLYIRRPEAEEKWEKRHPTGG